MHGARSRRRRRRFADGPESPDRAGPRGSASDAAAPSAQEVGLLRKLLEHSRDVMVVVDGQGKLRSCYPPDVLGSGPAALDGSFLGHVHPEDLAVATEQYLRLLREPGQSPPFLCRLRTTDDAWRWMEFIGTNLSDDPSIGGIILHGRDVTERHAADQAARSSARRFRHLVQHVTELILVWNERGEISYASPATIRFAIGEESADETNEITALTEFVHPDDVEMISDLVMELFPCFGESRNAVVRFRRFDAEYRSLTVTVTNLLRDESVCGIVANGRDVTEQLEFEGRLRQQEEWYRRLVQHGYEAIGVVGVGGEIRYLSPSIENVLGYQPADLTGLRADRIVNPDDLKLLAAKFGYARIHEGVHGPFEARVRNRGGAWRWLELVLTSRLDDPVVDGIVVNIRDVTDRREMEHQMAHQALHDPLTGLPNRNLLMDRLVQALERGQRNNSQTGVLFLDLDRFKYVNDTRGHGAGDELLTVVAARLRKTVRGFDTVARFGGDEFVVVVENVHDPAELLVLARRIAERVADPIHLDGRDFELDVSCGVALASGGPADDVLRDADAAMYAAKEQGGGQVVVFDDSIRDRVEHRVDIEHRLRRAIDHGELALAYQPIVDMETGRVLGREALVRWCQPDGTMLSPDDFIGLAEETGLIGRMGLWVIEGACRDLVGDDVSFPDGAYVAVNLSATQLRDESLAERIQAILQGTGIEPGRLVLEITETFLVDDVARGLTGLAALKALGVGLVVDDFGTRYSSLGYLHRMPLDGLKIDRTFVHRLDTDRANRAIVAAIIAMADTLGLQVVAEGVETDAQAATLRSLGCRYAQGYLYARPTSPCPAVSAAS